MSDTPPYSLIPMEARSSRSLAQKVIRASDVDRWSDSRNLDQGWNSRAQFVAALITAPARLIDLGCGAMALEKELPTGVTYIPADLVARDGRTHVFDVNAGTFPEVDADIAVALGLLEYVHEPARFFQQAFSRWGRLILSYHPTDVLGANPNRLSKGWLSDLTLDQVTDVARDAGYALHRIETFAKTDRIFDFRRAR